MPERRPYQAKLTAEAARGWDRLLTETGRTFTAVIEAIGEALAGGERPVPPKVLDRAREIDAARRSRRS